MSNTTTVKADNDAIMAELVAMRAELAATKAALAAKQTSGYAISSKISDNGNFSVKLKGNGMPIARKWQDWQFLLTDESIAIVRAEFAKALPALQAADNDPAIVAKRVAANAALAAQRREYAAAHAAK